MQRQRDTDTKIKGAVGIQTDEESDDERLVLVIG